MWQIVLNGPGYLDTPYELPPGETRIGRGDENEIVLAGGLVSRSHARLVVVGDRLYVEDVGSRNGTGVNGVAIDLAVYLSPGDVIDIGENQLQVRKRDPMREESTILVRRDASVPLERIEQARALDVLDERPEVAALVLLYRVSERLAGAASLERFLGEVADLVLEVARARSVMVHLVSQDGGAGTADELEAAVVRHRDGRREQPVPVSHGIMGECLRSGVALCVEDLARDARFTATESVLHQGPLQVICAPLSRGGPVQGLIYVTRDPDDAPLRPMVDAIAALAHLAGTGIEQQRLRERAAAEERQRQRLSRFLGHDLAAQLAGDISGSRMQERVATLVFADISGFTPLAERLPAERVVALLDEFYRRMARVIFSFGGTVDKFIGDEVMAIFGAPRASGDDAARALQAALAMRSEFDQMITARPPGERCHLKIGVNTGQVLAGTVGGDERLEYTAIGDAVNVASRLVGVAAPGQIVVGRSTVEVAGPGFAVRPLGVRQVRGRSGTVEVLELLGGGAP